MGFAATQGPCAGEQYCSNVLTGKTTSFVKWTHTGRRAFTSFGSKGCAHGAVGRGVGGRSITWLGVVRAGALPHLKAMLQPSSSPVSVLWASRLLKALAQVSRA